MRAEAFSQLVDAVRDAVLAQRRKIGTKGVGLDRINASVEICVVNRSDDIGTRDVEDFVAALELFKVVQRQVIALQHCAHRPICDDHSL